MSVRGFEIIGLQNSQKFDKYGHANSTQTNPNSSAFFHGGMLVPYGKLSFSPFCSNETFLCVCELYLAK